LPLEASLFLLALVERKEITLERKLVYLVAHPN
jgi:hypothetical protein